MKNRSLILLSLFGALLFVPRVAITYLPVHLVSSGVNGYLLGLAMTLFGGGYFIGSSLLKSRLFLNYRVMAAAFGLVIFSFLTYLFFHLSLVFSTLFVGLALGYLTAVVNLFLVAENNKQSKVSVYRIFLNVSAAASSVCFSLLAVHHYNAIALLVMVFALLTLGLSLLVKRQYQTIHLAKQPDREGMASTKRLKLFCLFNVLINVVYSQFYLLGPLYLVHVYHVQLINFAILGAISTASILLFEYLISKKMEKVNIKLSLLFGAGLIALSEGLLPFGRGVLYLYLAFIPFIFGEILYFPASTLMPRRMAPNDKSIARFIAVSNSWRSAAIVLSPLVFSVTHQLWQGNLYLYVCFALAILLFALATKQLFINRGSYNENNYCRR